MKTMSDSAWQRTGITLLWNEEELAKIGPVTEACSIHAFMRMRGAWPDDLPSQNGSSIVVGGLGMFLDLLPPEEANRWLETTFRQVLVEFQGWAEGARGLIFWFPGGDKRIRFQPSADHFTWACQGRWSDHSLDLGRVLWSGASQDAFGLVSAGGDPNHCRGLYLKRIS